jgi:hypothetical protein
MAFLEDFSSELRGVLGRGALGCGGSRTCVSAAPPTTAFLAFVPVLELPVISKLRHINGARLCCILPPAEQHRLLFLAAKTAIATSVSLPNKSKCDYMRTTR